MLVGIVDRLTGRMSGGHLGQLACRHSYKTACGRRYNWNYVNQHSWTQFTAGPSSSLDAKLIH